MFHLLAAAEREKNSIFHISIESGIILNEIVILLKRAILQHSLFIIYVGTHIQFIVQVYFSARSIYSMPALYNRVNLIRLQNKTELERNIKIFARWVVAVAVDYPLFGFTYAISTATAECDLIWRRARHRAKELTPELRARDYLQK